MISVRHPTGTTRRIFSSVSTFTNVYDWIGSLSDFPMHFSIVDEHGMQISPSTGVSGYGRQVLKMNEIETPISLGERSLFPSTSTSITNVDSGNDCYGYADSEDIPEDNHNDIPRSH